MRRKPQPSSWFWATLTLSSITVMSLVFALWELLENRFFSDLDYVTLHYLYVSRGIASGLLLAFWAAWLVMRERRDKEQRLQRLSERYRGIMDSTPGAVVLYDAGLTVLEWNTAAEELYGFPREEALGSRLPILPEPRRTELQELLQQVRDQGAVCERETERQARDGTPIAVQLSLIPFREGENASYFLEVTHDIRDRVRLRRMLLQVEKLTTMGTMATGTAHHLNTPLASMLLRVGMMREGKFESSLGEDLERIEDALHFCQNFVQQLLRFSRDPRSQKQPETLGSTLEAVLTFVQPQFRAKSVSLKHEFDGAGEVRVLADRNQLEALFLVLLSNACDAVERGGEVRVSAQRSGDQGVQIQISDNGCGIDPGSLPRIFEPFFTTKAPGRGTGLGLALASSIVQEHGGSLRIESVPRQGTTACVDLPTLRGPTCSCGSTS